MAKDIANTDPAEGSRDVIERELKRHEHEDLEPPHEPDGKKQSQQDKPN